MTGIVEDREPTCQSKPEPRLLIVETSSGIGEVALAMGERLVGQRRLEENRRNARDLAPSAAALLAEQGWRPRQIHAVIVSRGPGSYTGLRVGIMSAKTLAYATGCGLVAVETFACLARQAPRDVKRLDVIADAQQGNIYRQAFERNGSSESWQTKSTLSGEPWAVWLPRQQESSWVTGPGLVTHVKQFGAVQRLVSSELWLPKLETLLQVG